jgi:hypothetical protein
VKASNLPIEVKNLHGDIALFLQEAAQRYIDTTVCSWTHTGTDDTYVRTHISQSLPASPFQLDVSWNFPQRMPAARSRTPSRGYGRRGRKKKKTAKGNLGMEAKEDCPGTRDLSGLHFLPFLFFPQVNSSPSLS